MKILEQDGTKIGIKNCGQCDFSCYDFDKGGWNCFKDSTDGKFITSNYRYSEQDDYNFPVFCTLNDAILL